MVPDALLRTRPRGWGHLLFNMLTLYFFGEVVEKYFGAAFGEPAGVILYVVLYVSAIAVSTIGDLVNIGTIPPTAP